MAGQHDVQLAKAQRLFDDGHVDQAAWLMHQERLQALARNDAAGLAEIDDASSVMRRRLEGDERLESFEARLAGSGGPPAFELPANKVFDVTPLSFGIVLAGAR